MTFESDLDLREDSNDWHLDILVLQVVLVALAHEDETKEGEEDEEHMAKLAASLPWADLSWVGLCVQVVHSSMEPVSVWVHIQFIEVSELIEWMVLEVV